MGFHILGQMTHLSVKLTTAERLVAMFLAHDIADSSASGTPSIDYLAGICDLRVRTVKKALTRLEELGLISRRPGQGRSVGPKQQRTTLYVWNTEVARRQSLSDEAILRRGMASRTPSDQRRRYGCLVSEMDDDSTPSVMSDERPDEGEADESSSPAPAPASSPGLESVPAPRPAPEPEPEPEPQAPAAGKGLPSHPEWRRYAGAFKALGKDLTRFSARSWLRFVQQDGTSPEAIDARAALAADCAEQYVKDLRAGRRGFETEKGYAKSAEKFLTEGEWEKHLPRPEVPQPEPGEAVEDGCAGAPAPAVSFEEKHADYARAAAGDEGAIAALRRMLPSRFFEAPAGVPARWPGLIGVLGLRESFGSTEEDRAAFARAAGAVVEEEPAVAPEPAPEPVDGPAGVSSGGQEVSWDVAPVGELSAEYAEACAQPWEPHLAPAAPEPEASPDEPVAAVGDDEWGIAEGERAARSARYSAVGSAEEFREQALLAAQASQGALWDEGD